MKLSFLSKNLSSNQRGFFLIKSINDYLEKDKSYDIAVFTEEQPGDCIVPSFSVMQMVEAWGHQGDFIATDLSTACKLLNFPSARSKFFYIWDLEFLRGFAPINYDLVKKVYLNEDLKLIARCKHHAKIIENNFNRTVSGIVQDFNIDSLLEVMNGCS